MILTQDSLVVSNRSLPLIEEALARFLDQAESRGITLNAEMSRYHFASGGKRLRALIPCWVFEACGEDPARAVAIGCALEMVHNATLVHDDLQDGDQLRRGLPTIWKKYSPAQAINCGDAMFQFALELLLDQDLPAPQLKKMSLRFLKGITEVIEGQAQEFLMKDEALPSVERYLGVVRGKTAALIATAFGVTAMALGKSESAIHEVEQAGMALGVLFQMQDDVLDVYGDKGRDQKATDIAEGKISILIAQVLEDANASDRARIQAILRKPREVTSASEIQEVISLLKQYGTLPRVLEKISALRKSISTMSIRTSEPQLHRLLTELGELFLKPISHLLEASA